MGPLALTAVHLAVRPGDKVVATRSLVGWVMQQSEHYTKAERLGHLISWLILISVPIGALLVVGGWLPHPFGDLGAISDIFLIIVGAVFVHGIAQISGETGTGI